jgi:hypothetical protein
MKLIHQYQTKDVPIPRDEGIVLFKRHGRTNLEVPQRVSGVKHNATFTSSGPGVSDGFHNPVEEASVEDLIVFP